MAKPHTNKKPLDVPADNPHGTMERFTEGLQRVVAAPPYPARKHKKRKKSS